jgi:hypothetical protein
MSKKRRECPHNPECRIPGGYLGDLCAASVGGRACTAPTREGVQTLCGWIHEDKQNGKASEFVALVQAAPRLPSGGLDVSAIHKDPWHQ